MLQSAASFIPVPLIGEAVGVALKIIEICEEGCEVCKILPRKGCKMINNILLPEYIRRQSNGQRAEREGTPSVRDYRRNFYTQQ